jgi:hypothetical protein
MEKDRRMNILTFVVDKLFGSDSPKTPSPLMSISDVDTSDQNLSQLEAQPSEEVFENTYSEYVDDPFVDDYIKMTTTELLNTDLVHTARDKCLDIVQYPREFNENDIDAIGSILVNAFCKNGIEITPNILQALLIPEELTFIDSSNGPIAKPDKLVHMILTFSGSEENNRVKGMGIFLLECIIHHVTFFSFPKTPLSLSQSKNNNNNNNNNNREYSLGSKLSNEPHSYSRRQSRRNPLQIGE